MPRHPLLPPEALEASRAKFYIARNRPDTMKEDAFDKDNQVQ